MKTETFRVELPFACFAVDVDEDGKIATSSAPMARKFYGKNYLTFLNWVIRKGGTSKPLNGKIIMTNELEDPMSSDGGLSC